MGREIIASKKDFRIETFCASGPGGQHRNKVETAVRITHIPSGLSSYATDSRSQQTNRESAFRKLAPQVISWLRKSLDTDREDVGLPTEIIRTYHDKRGTAKDHRTGVTLPLESVLDGDIQPFIDAMLLDSGKDE